MIMKLTKKIKEYNSEYIESLKLKEVGKLCWILWWHVQMVQGQV
jgi:hypothetical protein